MEREASVAASNYVEEYRALLPRQIGHVNEIEKEHKLKCTKTEYDKLEIFDAKKKD